jgi:hypothetical protein
MCMQHHTQWNSLCIWQRNFQKSTLDYTNFLHELSHKFLTHHAKNLCTGSSAKSLSHVLNSNLPICTLPLPTAQLTHNCPCFFFFLDTLHSHPIYSSSVWPSPPIRGLSSMQESPHCLSVIGIGNLHRMKVISITFILCITTFTPLSLYNSFHFHFQCIIAFTSFHCIITSTFTFIV